MKRVLFVGACLLVTVTAAEAIECAAEVPANRTGSWYYRTIDGRKCWYQGKGIVPKSELYWAEPALANAQASMTVAPSVAIALPEAQKADDVDDGSFASRWRGLEVKPLEVRP
jgi:hypothetical protein